MAKPKNPPKAGEYAVGRGKPPLHTQWPKGVSGNPGGKKKTSIDLPRIFDAASQRPIIVKLDGEKREISSLEAVVMRLFEIGLKGDMRAITTILDRSSLLLKASGGDQNVETSEEDLEILPGRSDAIQRSASLRSLTPMSSQKSSRSIRAM
jgi:hypothetical protein